MEKLIYMRSLLKTDHLFHEKLYQIRIFFLLPPPVTSVVEIIMYLPAHIVLDRISLDVVLIENKLMNIFNKTSLTVLD